MNTGTAEQLAASALGQSMVGMNDIAAHLGIHPKSVARMRGEGRLPRADFECGKIVRWRASTITKWCAEHREKR